MDTSRDKRKSFATKVKHMFGVKILRLISGVVRVKDSQLVTIGMSGDCLVADNPSSDKIRGQHKSQTPKPVRKPKPNPNPNDREQE